MSFEKDRVILRELSRKYNQICFSDDNFKKMSTHRDVNDLKRKKPILLIEEIPWHEMNINNQLTLECGDELCRQIEWFFKERLFRHKYIPADAVYQPFFPLGKTVSSTGIGVDRVENEHEQSAQSHTFVDQFQCEEDLQKLHDEVITYHKEDTMKNLEFVGEMIGDIIPIKLIGFETGYGLGLKNMDDIVNFRGLDSFFYDFIEQPEFMHKLISKLTDIFINKIEQLEQMDLLEGDAYSCHATAGLSNDLPKAVKNVKRENVWGRGLAQIFASVSPQMHDEFDTQYMIKALSGFGMVYYGCCEPLDKKIDIISRIPNLRKISVTPWADVDSACEQIGDRYVVASKPNPSALACDCINEVTVKTEIEKICMAIKKNNCSADIVLKDITTVNANPENLIKWHDTAKEVINQIFD